MRAPAVRLGGPEEACPSSILVRHWRWCWSMKWAYERVLALHAW